jgi:carbonic anhydrase
MTTSDSKILKEVLDANAGYAAEFGDKKDLALPPARGFAILTCMDARLDPAKYAGLAEGDAHVIRNAGGRATDDAIRSLVISHKLLGTNEWFVIHHSNCGMELFSDEIIGDLLDDSLETASFDGKVWSNPKNGTRSPIRKRASNRMSAASASIRWCPATSRSTASSTTSTADAWSR